ncbi:MAG: 16S rRNA (guanine(527)-N(7))-methyltransferase RsmG [Aquificaceae bacterium]|nr:16S rRNA (guanine(527)-N(7))-methyltransferase RsmG [Aquificaceae bacterium]MDW8095240.1 16S rRNA (guanine(527)-N(7))-methyltransferase RsmG [Aquificaceae bacterium]
MDSFSLYMQELKRWNKVHNLTAIEEDREIIVRHFLDSLTVSLCLESKGVNVDGLSFCDVGSGAGFPGVPLKIYYGDRIQLTLVEAVAKKCAFLEYIKVKLRLSYKVICQQAQRVHQKFDVVVARALGETSEVLPLLQSFSNGWVLVMRGSQPLEGYDHCRIELPDVKSYILFLAKTK